MGLGPGLAITELGILGSQALCYGRASHSKAFYSGLGRSKMKQVEGAAESSGLSLQLQKCASRGQSFPHCPVWHRTATAGEVG